MSLVRAATTAALVAIASASVASMVGALGPKAAADEEISGPTTLRLFEHDTQQTALDLGDPGPGPGDQFLFAGDVFDRQGGIQLGRIAGQCTRLSGDATAGDEFCAVTLTLDGGEIGVQTVTDSAALFQRAETVPLAIVGGTGLYRNVRGEGTFQAPNQTDGNVVLNLIGG